MLYVMFIIPFSWFSSATSTTSTFRFLVTRYDLMEVVWVIVIIIIEYGIMIASSMMAIFSRFLNGSPSYYLSSLFMKLIEGFLMI